jgi:hypothetical protein
MMENKGDSGTSFTAEQVASALCNLGITVKTEHAAETASAVKIAMVTVQMSIPEFWAGMPRLWFAQFESIMGPQNQSDAKKFEMAVAKLSRDALRQVSDLVQIPPASGKYNALKKRLLTVYEESAEAQFQKLVSDMDLGTQKPSQLLRRMAELAKNCGITGDPLKKLWINRLPPSVRAVLAVSGDTRLEDLAAIADKILENLQTGEVAAVSSSSTSGGNREIMEQLRQLPQEMAKIKQELTTLRGRERTPFRNYGQQSKYRGQSGSRSRDESVQRRAPRNQDWLCPNHYKFRERASSCTTPCSWERRKQQQQQPAQGN